MELPETPFRVTTISATDDPQTLAYLALHTDYSADYICATELKEEECGDITVDRLLKGNRGHWGPLEHMNITLAIRCDHNTLMQLARHRLLSFDIQSMRYTSTQYCGVAHEKIDVEEVFYVRPKGIYESRDKKGYAWSDRDVAATKERIIDSCKLYDQEINRGVAPEHARMMLPTCYLQNAVVTGNLRAWLHVCEIRNKLNAQLEIQTISELIALELQKWCPEVMSWWRTNRERKAVLAP